MSDLEAATPKAPGQKDAPDPSLGGPIRHIVESAHKWGGNGTKPDFNKIKRVLTTKHPEVIARAFGGDPNRAAAWIKDNWAAAHGISFPGKTGSGPTYWRKGGGHVHASMLCSWWQPSSDDLFTMDGEELFCGSDTATESDGLIWKTILREGTWKRNPIPGQEDKPLVIDRQFMDDLIAANQDGAWEFVTIPLTHADRVHENTGYVRQLKMVEMGGKATLRAGLEFTEPDIKQKVLNGSIANVSVGVGFNVARTQDGKTYKRVLKHVALTNAPWINGLPAFGSEDMAAGKVDMTDVRFSSLAEDEDVDLPADLDFSCLLELPEVTEWPISPMDKIRSKVDDLLGTMEDVFESDGYTEVHQSTNYNDNVSTGMVGGKADGTTFNDPDDDDSIGFPADVHHRDATDPVTSCATCQFFANQTCSKYNAPTEADDTCDSWDAANDEGGNKGDIDGLNADMGSDPDNDGDNDSLGGGDTDHDHVVGGLPLGTIFVHGGGRYTRVASHPKKKKHSLVRHLDSGKESAMHDDTKVHMYAAQLEILEPSADEMLLAANAGDDTSLGEMNPGDVFVSHHGHTYTHMGPHPVRRNHIVGMHTATGRIRSFPAGQVVKKVAAPMPDVANGATRTMPVGPPYGYGSYLSKEGGDHMSEETKELQLTRDDLDRMVSERVEAELTAAKDAAREEAAKEREALELELSRNRRAVHEMKVRERVAELSKAGHSPAVVKVAQELMLADDRGEAMLTLSRESGEAKLSITDVVNELLEAFPKTDAVIDQPAKLDLSIKPESGEDSVEAANKDFESLFGKKA